MITQIYKIKKLNKYKDFKMPWIISFSAEDYCGFYSHSRKVNNLVANM